MTYLISRANYARCTEGMSDAQRAEFDRDFVCYPERFSPDDRIDVDQVADRYERLHARETVRPPQPRFAGWERPVKASPTIRELEEDCRGRGDDIVDVDTLMREWATAHDDARRYYLNAWTHERPTDPLGDLLACRHTFEEMDLPRPQRLACGETALAAIQITTRHAKLRATDQPIVALTGMPAVADPDLPPDAWQLVDALTGEVLHEGTVGPGLTAMIQQIREDVDDLAERTCTPRDLLWD